MFKKLYFYKATIEGMTASGTIKISFNKNPYHFLVKKLEMSYRGKEIFIETLNKL